MRLFAGESFLASGPLLQILTVAAAAVFFGTLFGHAVVAVGKQKPMTWGYAADAALATVLYLALIPKYGTTAAAWITVASEAFIAGATFLMVHRVTGFVPDLRHSGKALAAAVLMAAFVAMLPEMHVLLKALFGLVAYGALSVAFGTVTPRLLREIAYVRKPEA
jgi:O-antigen/teichoic acid export membrane protein